MPQTAFEKIAEGLQEATAVARGEAPAAAIWHDEFRYVPETETAAAHARGREEGAVDVQERAAGCAAMWRSSSAVRLAAGELTAQELRTAQAVASGIERAIRSLPAIGSAVPDAGAKGSGGAAWTRPRDIAEPPAALAATLRDLADECEQATTHPGNHMRQMAERLRAMAARSEGTAEGPAGTPLDEIRRFLGSAPSIWPDPAQPHDMEAIGARVGHCHENCDAWVQSHSSDRVVRGWIIAAQGLAFRHSVIETAGGNLLDVTPREPGQSQEIFEFKRWMGSKEAFQQAPDQVLFTPAGGFQIPGVFPL